MKWKDPTIFNQFVLRWNFHVYLIWYQSLQNPNWYSVTKKMAQEWLIQKGMHYLGEACLRISRRKDEKDLITIFIYKRWVSLIIYLIVNWFCDSYLFNNRNNILIRFRLKRCVFPKCVPILQIFQRHVTCISSHNGLSTYLDNI